LAFGVHAKPDLRIVAAFKVRVAHMDAIRKRILKPAHQFVGQVLIKEQHG
jgi:predicted transcriptional regulator